MNITWLWHTIPYERSKSLLVSSVEVVALQKKHPVGSSTYVSSGQVDVATWQCEQHRQTPCCAVAEERSPFIDPSPVVLLSSARRIVRADMTAPATCKSSHHQQSDCQEYKKAGKRAP